jgi:cytoskeletal protein RodZ
MKTVGQILKEKRLEKNITLETVEQDIKIRKKFLEDIESDNYQRLPSQAYIKGFVKNYSEYLGLNSKTMMAFFRRQTREVTRSSILPKGVVEPLNKPGYVLTPGRFISFLFFVLFVLFLLYFGYQYRKLQIPPKVTIDSPKEHMITTGKRIDVTGTTDPDATVSVNGVGVLVRSDGKFFDQVALFPGKNTITIVVVSRHGKSVTITRDVIVEEEVK